MSFSCCDSVAALALANFNEHVAEANITAPAHTKRALHGPLSSRGKSCKITLFSRSGYTRAFLRHFLFPVPNFHTELLPALSLPRAPRLQAVSLRKIVHMHGIGGDGEYCGENDAQLDHINVFTT